MRFNIYKQNSRSRMFMDSVSTFDLAIRRIDWLANENPNTRFIATDICDNVVAEAWMPYTTTLSYTKNRMILLTDSKGYSWSFDYDSVITSDAEALKYAIIKSEVTGNYTVVFSDLNGSAPND